MWQVRPCLLHCNFFSLLIYYRSFEICSPELVASGVIQLIEDESHNATVMTVTKKRGIGIWKSRMPGMGKSKLQIKNIDCIFTEFALLLGNPVSPKVHRNKLFFFLFEIYYSNSMMDGKYFREILITEIKNWTRGNQG